MSPNRQLAYPHYRVRRIDYSNGAHIFSNHRFLKSGKLEHTGHGKQSLRKREVRRSAIPFTPTSAPVICDEVSEFPIKMRHVRARGIRDGSSLLHRTGATVKEMISLMYRFLFGETRRRMLAKDRKEQHRRTEMSHIDELRRYERLSVKRRYRAR